jgi:ubiquinone/menaquinone biosynthesis C-methylase UbiE
MASTNQAAAAESAGHAVEERDLKARQRAMWALGDYHTIARRSLWSFGAELVAACGISAGQRVLDVAAGTGNVAIRAAEAGARVIASDLTPENFEAGRSEARAHGVQLEWVEADAEALPFRDGEFDVVTSSVGAIFAPNHQRVADELVRVCRPGGVIGMIAVVPSGPIVDLLDTVERYARASLFSSMSPLQWGREEHARKMFGSRVHWLQLRRMPFLLGQFEGPRDFIDYFIANHPMMVWLHHDLAGQPDRVATLDRELLEVAERWMGGTGNRTPADHGEYLLLVARKCLEDDAGEALTETCRRPAAVPVEDDQHFAGNPLPNEAARRKVDA